MAGFSKEVGSVVTSFIKGAEAEIEDLPEAAQTAFARLKLLAGQEVSEGPSEADTEGYAKLKVIASAAEGDLKTRTEGVVKKLADLKLGEAVHLEGGCTLVCPECGAKLTPKPGEEYEGVKCPKCGAAMKKTEIQKAEDVRYVCSKCEHEITAKAGEVPECPECGIKMQAVKAEERKLAESGVFRIASGRIIEAVEGTEGLQWDVIMITEGESRNRRRYQGSVLESAIPLFSGVDCFADHPTKTEEKDRPERSIRDLVGWFESPRMGETPEGKRGILATLNVLASEGWFKDKLTEAWERGKQDLVTFSINGKGTHKLVRENGHIFMEVLSLNHIKSVDAVTEAAAGGRLVRMLASEGETDMNIAELLESLTPEELRELKPELFAEPPSEPTPPEPDPTPAPTPAPQVSPQVNPQVSPQISPEFTALQAEVATLRESARKADREARLTIELQTSELPEPVKDKVKKRFSTLEFTDEELTEAVREEKEVLAKIMPQADFRPFARVSEDARDSIDKRMDGLFEGVDVEKHTRFRSIKEAYSVVTGRPYLEVDAFEILRATAAPFDSADKRLRETVTATTWTHVFGTSITRQLLKEYALLPYDDWRKVCSSVQTLPDMKLQTRVRTGGYGELAEITGSNEYGDFVSPDDEYQTYTPARYGKMEGVTFKAIANDDLGAITRIPKSIAMAAKVGLYKAVFDLFTANAVMDYDSTALFHTDHTNLGSLALSSDTLQAAKLRMRAHMQPVGSTETEQTFLVAKPAYLLIPPELEVTAWELLKSPTKIVSGMDSTVPNIHYNSFKEFLIIDHWPDADDWYLTGDPALIPTIEVGFYGSQTPQIFTEVVNTGSHFERDLVRYKVRHVRGAVALEHRGMDASIVG